MKSGYAWSTLVSSSGVLREDSLDNHQMRKCKMNGKSYLSDHPEAVDMMTRPDNGYAPLRSPVAQSDTCSNCT